MDSLKKAVVNSNFEPVPTIFNETIASINDTGIQLVTKVPSFKSVKSSLYYNRNKKENIKKIKFNKPEDVEIPPKFNDFLIADYCDDANRILIFASEEAKSLMSVLEHFFGDGTFKSCPTPFKQIYTIHGDDNSDMEHTRVIPLVYVIMTKMNENTYKIVFDLIKTVIPNWKPLKFTSDFEKAAMNAMQFIFPEVQIKGCQIHMAKAVKKRAKELKLDKNKLLNRTVALCTALPLLPRNLIIEGWNYILDVMNSDEKLNSFSAYMFKQWLKDEKFIDVWCVSEERHRTTNCLEGWHNRINKKIRGNCNLMTVLNALKCDSDLNIVKKKYINEKRSENSINRDLRILYVVVQVKNGKITVGHSLEMLR